MGTVLIECSAFESPELIRIGVDGCRMWVEAICWGSRNQRTRIVPREWTQMQFPRKWRRVAAKLIDVGLFAPHPHGYEILENRLWKFGGISPERWSTHAYGEVYARDGKVCRYCGESSDLSIDHVIPRCQGGTDHAANLVVACRPCNSRKHGRTPEQAGMVLREIQVAIDTGASMGPISSSESNTESDA